ATTSNIGTGNTPSCFNGGTPQRDVWFSFTTTPAVDAYTFTVVGTDAGGTSPLRNPQIALYRGSCQLDGLGELGCATAPNGQTSVSLEASGLSSGITYYLRVNDYSATASPNSGGFQLCISETSSTFNMGERDGSTACTGTLFDSGGASEMYDSNENNTFTICPQSFHQCILLDVKSFASEQNFDNLRVYAGEEQRSENLIARLTGVVAAEGFQIQTDSECVTLVFNSDLLIADDGFQIDWSCTAASCSGSTTENPTVIDNIPFSESASTCSAGATFINSPCTDDVFIAGPEVVYAYETTGGSCLQIELSGARAQTGIAVFDGDPTVSGSACVASTTGSLLLNVDVTTAGTYYIVVANADGCTDYSIDIEDTPCMLNASLENAICQPINSCINEQGTPTQLIFERGFQDIEISAQNGGCWSGTGFNPSFLWFSVQTAAAGDFGFIANSPDTPSDIDFNVWGPFSPSAICEDPDIVRNTVQFQSPIRSSFSSKPAATGLANINPVTGEAVTDTYDCRNDTGTIVTETDGDDFVRTIDAQADEVYIVLLNDWGGQIQSSGMLMDFSPSSPGLLQLENAEVRSTALAICAGDEAQIVVESTSDQIEWLNDTETLSCD
ncbi:MAG: PPC domain-containing protein, partial [Bacteroidota bacterium]